MAEEKLGDLLVRKGLINPHQLTKALEFQAKLNEKNYMPIGEILISFGYLSRAQILESLAQQKGSSPPPPPPPPPSFAPPPPPPPSFSAPLPPVDVKVDKAPLAPTPKAIVVVNTNMRNAPTPPAQKVVYDKNKPIGEILLEKGFIERYQLSKALEYQAVLPKTNYKPIGEILVELHYVTREQLNESLGIQPPLKQGTLGEILKQLGIIDDTQLAMVLMQQHSVGDKQIPIGELLVQHGFISQKQLNQALEIQKNQRS